MRLTASVSETSTRDNLRWTVDAPNGWTRINIHSDGPYLSLDVEAAERLQEVLAAALNAAKEQR